MNMLWSLCLALTYFSATSLAEQHSFRNHVPNGDRVTNPCDGSKWRAIDSKRPRGGGGRNPFGKDFHEAKGHWTKKLCNLDSDLDGRTNGQELGDPNCIWKIGDTPEREIDITHPGICDPFDSDRCIEMGQWFRCDTARGHGVGKHHGCQLQGAKTLKLKFPNAQFLSRGGHEYCMTFDLPQEGDYHLVATKPIVDKRHIIKRMFLIGCDKHEVVPVHGPNRCRSTIRGPCRSVISVWSHGETLTCFNRRSQFRFGITGFHKVMIHVVYHRKHGDIHTPIGMHLYYKPAKLGIKSLHSFAVGQMVLDIPQNSNYIYRTGICPARCLKHLLTKPAYVVKVYIEMEQFGRSMKIELFRKGQRIHTLAHDEHFKYNSTATHIIDPPIEMQPGDEIRTTCIYDSSRRHNYHEDKVDVGETCLGHLFAYPKDAFRSNWCVSFSTMSMCDVYLGKPFHNCQWKHFTDPQNVKTTEMFQEVTESCNVNGECRPECRRVIDRLRGRPCMQGEAFKLVSYWLQRSYRGALFLGRLQTCGFNGAPAAMTVSSLLMVLSSVVLMLM